MRTRETVLLARTLRQHMTPEERKLWSRVRRRRLGCTVRRQHPYDSYVLDFHCPAARLAIELDGAHHEATSDAKRDAHLSEKENRLVREKIEDVVKDIQTSINARRSRRG